MLTINNTTEGYLKDIEIKGNTWQDSENLADIRSVGTKVEGQELYEIPVLSCGKNLFDGSINRYDARVSTVNGYNYECAGYSTTNHIKVKGNTPYTVQTGQDYYYAVYDKDKNHIGGNIASSTIWLSEKVEYIRFDFVSSNISTVQIEEGKVATPYEPYQEDKLTILSPTPLEKVGDVADRIICKDGVWGVEKNIKDILFTNETKWIKASNDTTNYCVFYTDLADIKPLSIVISNKIPSKSDGVIYNNCTEFAIGTHNTSNTMKICIENNKLNSNSVEGLKAWLRDNGEVYAKYVATQPTFIPLPHSQQIKLRTFAGRTNIHFETEIEGTIKASVPKSLGATVNSHTSQIDNLNKELDRVKKLEESTVSTVTSDKAFTTIAETTGGYFEDVKVEGKTLVNLCSNFRIVNMHSYQSYIELDVSPNTKYTVIVPIYANHVYGIFSSDGKKTIVGYRLASICNIFNFTSNDDTNFRLYCRLYDEQGSLALKGELNKNACDVILLEGDHTDKDLSYFEGLKSVGQDTDEISVLSHYPNGNLIDFKPFTSKEGVGENVKGFKAYFPKGTTKLRYKFILDNGDELIDYNNISIGFRDANDNVLSTKYMNPNGVLEFNDMVLDKCTNISFYYNSSFGAKTVSKVYFYKHDVELSEIKQDKKQILYYNPTTQTWEKPVLREWDSIEKHSDGKYYYHKRSGELVLNGSENIVMYKMHNNTISFNIYITDIISNNSNNYFILDKINFNKYCYDLDVEGASFSPYVNKNIYFNISKSKLTTQDVAGFKQWLQDNPVTVVYQLTKEEVYECTNLDLITYSGETNLIVNSGAIQPKITLKVLSNISNVVKLLQEKVSVLENKFINGLKQVLAGDMMSLAYLLYPEDFDKDNEVKTLEEL